MYVLYNIPQNGEFGLAFFDITSHNIKHTITLVKNVHRNRDLSKVAYAF